MARRKTQEEGANKGASPNAYTKRTREGEWERERENKESGRQKRNKKRGGSLRHKGETHPDGKGQHEQGKQRRNTTHQKRRGDSDGGSNRGRDRTGQTGTDHTDRPILTKQAPFGPFLERSDGGRSLEFLIRLEFRIKLIKLVPYLGSNGFHRSTI